jgi:cyanuric acid amidohydrolase
MTWQVDVHVVPMADPADWSALDRLLDAGCLRAEEIVAVFGKTEGNGCVNDFTRAYASQTLAARLTGRGGVPAERLPVIVMSGGSEGVLSPHATIFARRAVAAAPSPEGALMVAAAHTAPLPPEQLGRVAQAEMVAATVERLIAEAAIAADRVALVQVKCPLLTAARVREARSRGADVATTETYDSMALSRAASALGVAVALGEVAPSRIDDAAIGREWSLFSSVASTSSGAELINHEICVLGTSREATGPLRVGRAVMAHPLDQGALGRALADAGAGSGGAADRLVQLFAKAEAPPDGLLLGARHTMLDDSDIQHSRMARAVVGAVLAAAAGRTRIYVSGGAEHQGPPGGGPFCIIARS